MAQPRACSSVRRSEQLRISCFASRSSITSLIGRNIPVSRVPRPGRAGSTATVVDRVPATARTRWSSPSLIRETCACPPGLHTQDSVRAVPQRRSIDIVRFLDTLIRHSHSPSCPTPRAPLSSALVIRQWRPSHRALRLRTRRSPLFALLRAAPEFFVVSGSTRIDRSSSSRSSLAAGAPAPAQSARDRCLARFATAAARRCTSFCLHRLP